MKLEKKKGTFGKRKKVNQKRKEIGKREKMKLEKWENMKNGTKGKGKKGIRQ